jgi:hypothetical protein
MIRFGLAAATLSLMVFYVVANMDAFPVFRIVVMPLADGTPVPVLAGLHVPNFVISSIIGIAGGVAITFAGMWGLRQASAIMSAGSAMATEPVAEAAA